MEGLLEFRAGKGVIGKFENFYFRIKGSSLEKYDAADQACKTLLESFDLGDMSALSVDEGKGEMSFSVDSKKLRMRCKPAEGIAAWEKALENGSAGSTGAKDAKDEKFNPPSRKNTEQEPDSPKAKSSRKNTEDVEPDKATAKKKINLKKKSSEQVADADEKKASKDTTPPTTTTKAEDAMSPASQALLAVQSHLDLNKLTVRKFFKELDAGDEDLDSAAFRQGLDTLCGYRPSNADFKLIMAVIDRSGENTVNKAELDKALKMVSRGEDIMASLAGGGTLYHAMIQVDTVMDIPASPDADFMYLVRAKWTNGEGKGTKADPRPSKSSGNTEEVAVRQQLKLKGEPGAVDSVITVSRKSESAGEEFVGQCQIKVTDDSHQEVHVVQLVSQKGEITGISMRLRVKVKEQKSESEDSGQLERLLALQAQASKEKEKVKDQEKEKPPSQAVLQAARLHQMYALHAERTAKLEEKRKEGEVALMKKLQDEAEQLKSKRTKGQPANPKEASERLYNDHKEVERKRRMRQFQREEEDRRNNEQVRQTRAMNRSFSDATLRTSREAADRLYDHALNRREIQIRKKEEADAAAIEEAKKMADRGLSERAKSQGAQERQQARITDLYEEAANRKERLEKARSEKHAAEEKKLKDQVVGAQRTTGVTKEKLEELWKDHAARQRKQALALAEKHIEEQAQIQKEKEEAKVRRTLNFNKKETVEKVAGDTPFWHRLSAPREKSDKTADAEQPKAKPKLENATFVDYTLDTMLRQLQVRTCVPRAPDRRLLLDPLQEVLIQYKVAFGACNKGEGCTNLIARASQRLFPDGHLMPDFVGWQFVCEPGPIRQVDDDLDELLMTAALAQNELEQLISPTPEPWRPGSYRSKPAAVPMALFAQSAGPKTAEAARVKATVRYGPAEGPRKYRHLTDLARVSLVFASCDLLQAGLDVILGDFEVVDVRNNFRTPSRSGCRNVEVLVILEIDMGNGSPPRPHVCEIRLEEHNYWKAANQTQPFMEQLLSVLTHHYGMLGRDPSCIEYLARYILTSPYESHGLRVFKRHIMRRWGSVASCWRKYFGNNRLMPFLKFRDVCKELNCREHSTAYWEELDIGRGGSISLYELDPESCSLLAKFRARLLALADVTDPDEVDAETLWGRLTFPIRCNREGRLEVSEFKNVLKPLGFSSEEAMIIFNCLDPAGGHTFRPPAYISISDIGWVKRLHQFVDLNCITLSKGEGMNENDGLRFVTWNSRSPGNERTFGLTDRPTPGDPGSPLSNGVPIIEPPHWAKAVAEEGDDGEETELHTHSEMLVRQAPPPLDAVPPPAPEPTPAVQEPKEAQVPTQAAADEETKELAKTPTASLPEEEDDYQEASAEEEEDADYDEAEDEEEGAGALPLDLEEETF
mmetsp:Transcript_105368/g.187342  ORF Transcript_105368/g.187342 Transcript_105368/m.187342 type:complete len:1389 (-) Transcript_105368:59-4225(-)